jgi:hypothetical protein
MLNLEAARVTICIPGGIDDGPLALEEEQDQG